MQKKFEINRSKIKGGCQSGRKVVTYNSKSDLPLGMIKGALISSRNGRNIFAYRSIPYAKPPIGELRFKKPVLLLENAWDGIFDGSGKVDQCVQPARGSSFWSNIAGTEDCLHLSIYVPQTESIPKEGLPVMAWIHGGGFNTGNSTALKIPGGFVIAVLTAALLLNILSRGCKSFFTHFCVRLIFQHSYVLIL